MAITTNRAHVVRALDFFAKNDIYFAIGQPTSWPDDNNPPAPDPAAVDLNGLIGMKKVENMYLVVPDPNGTISYRDSNWTAVPADSALAQGAKWVYMDTTIRYDELPLGYYRQVGVYSGVQLFAGVKEVDTLTITANATAAGSITVTLNGVYVNIAVTPGMTVSQIADKIRTTPVNGWTVGGTAGTAMVTFTSNVVGTNSTPVFTGNGTGVTGTVSATTPGQAATPSNATALLPSQIGSTGRLEVLDNRSPANRQADQKEKLSLVIEF